MDAISHQIRYFIIQNNNFLLFKSNNRLLNDVDISTCSQHFLRYFSIGTFHGIEYHCAEIESRFSKDVFQVIPLKKAISLLTPEQFAACVKAYSVINWDKNHRFCGRCGLSTEQNNIGFERICRKCNLSFFPRISPSIIVLIYKDDQLIMARSPHYAPGVYGLIAGFVEMGETLEEAVHREVKEEIGITIKNLSYFDSQPWPFPDSLMIAYTAEYDSGELIIDNDEIEEAGLPSTSISIASKLLNRFISSCKKKKGS